MCLILIAHRTNAQSPLLVLANRDEFYARPTAIAAPWDECPELIAGRDLVSGGSWFGARGTRWASVTNIREGHGSHHSTRSRGWLVRNYLLGQESPQHFLAGLAGQATEFAGFNLLVGDGEELWYSNNRGTSGQRLKPGIYGLSNALLDTPWPKVIQGKQALNKLLARPHFNQARAFAILADTSLADDDELPRTGIPLDWERALSAAFISKGHYGTRCSSLFMKAGDNGHLFIERRYASGPKSWEQSEFNW